MRHRRVPSSPGASSGPAARRSRSPSCRSRARGERRPAALGRATSPACCRAISSCPATSGSSIRRPSSRAPASPPEAIDFVGWAAIGAQELVKGTIETTGDTVTVEVRLFDVRGTPRRGGSRAAIPGRAQRRCRAGAHATPTSSSSCSPASAVRSTRRSRSSARASGPLKDVYVYTFDCGAGQAHQRAVHRRCRRAGSRIAAASCSPRTATTSRGSSQVDLATPRRASVLGRRRASISGGAWSPDGSQVLVSARGRRQHRHRAARSLRARWCGGSPTTGASTCRRRGRRTAVASRSARRVRGSPQIYVMNVDGSGRTRVSRTGNYNTSPAWSPKGDRIAWTTRERERLPDRGRERRRLGRAHDHRARAATRIRRGRRTAATSCSRRRAADGASRGSPIATDAPRNN